MKFKYDIFGPRPDDGPLVRREPAEPETTEDLLRKIYGLHFRVGLFFVITWTVFVLPLCLAGLVVLWGFVSAAHDVQQAFGPFLKGAPH